MKSTASSPIAITGPQRPSSYVLPRSTVECAQIEGVVSYPNHSSPVSFLSCCLPLFAVIASDLRMIVSCFHHFPCCFLCVLRLSPRLPSLQSSTRRHLHITLCTCELFIASFFTYMQCLTQSCWASALPTAHPSIPTLLFHRATQTLGTLGPFQQLPPLSQRNVPSALPSTATAPSGSLSQQHSSSGAPSRPDNCFTTTLSHHATYVLSPSLRRPRLFPTVLWRSQEPNARPLGVACAARREPSADI